jgi:hypothetical protein
MLGMTPVAQNTIGIQYYCSAATVAWIQKSNPDIWAPPPVNVACRLWVNAIAMSIKAASLFVLSTRVMSGLLKGTVRSVSRVQYHRVFQTTRGSSS